MGGVKRRFGLKIRNFAPFSADNQEPSRTFVRFKNLLQSQLRVDSAAYFARM